MSESDIVRVSVSIAAASSPTVANLTTGLVAAYHTHYPDRVRVYSTATALEEMVADGFSTSEPAYLAVEKYASAPTTPANVCIGRRANAFTQVIDLDCVDGTVSDSYDFNVVSTLDGKTHAIAYTNVINLGGAASGGTVTTTQGSPSITFSTSQTMAAGGCLVFNGTGGQPGVYYALSGSVSGTAGTLTGVYAGIGGAGETFTYLPPLAGTADVINGSSTVATSTTQVGSVLVGDSVQFTAQLGTYYTVEAVTAAHLVLTQPYLGTTNAATTFQDVCSATTAAQAIKTQLLAVTSNIGVPTVTGASLTTVTITQVPGLLNDINGWASNGFSSIQLEDVTSDPGITADLTAIVAANTGAFYAVMLDSNSAAEVEAAAAFIEATGTGGKVFFWNNSDYGNTQTTVTDDVFSELKADTYVRDVGQQNDTQLLSYGGASACSNALARNPGSYSLAFFSEPGVPADSVTTLTESQQLALNGMTASAPGPSNKNGNWYASVAGENILFPGTAPSGRFFDLTILIDWLQVTMQQRCFAVLVNNAQAGKTPFTDFGLAQLAAAVDSVLRLGSTPAYGGILPDGQDPTRPIKVTVTPVADISVTDRTNRNVPAGAITWTAGIAGAVETATIQGVLQP